ncbi:DUF6794 domain-containing protein [uncultured Psychroserpens sp.]|uniref:DUF6794 domain-containing protein n=1 Tax=uncultured Psychroserpens sp. TaxID=255436 RepID=UPI00261C0CFC|nr:DUF6794 domain-containing protein [uncultured Psychroserpens sp.]
MKFKFVFLFLISVTFSYSSSTKITRSNYVQQPRTYLEAIDHIYNLLSDADRDYVKNVPFYDLIIFHRGWGMGIRNDLGLWGKNKELLDSCADANGTKTIHPENASQLIIEGVWKKLNDDISFIDFSKLEPEDYFNRIHQTILLAKKENNTRPMLVLPSWVYEQWQYWDDEKRLIALSDMAKKLVKDENDLGNLALLFLSQNSKNSELIEDKLKQKIENFESIDILLPEFLVNEQDKKTVSKLKPLTSREFALICYGMLYNKTFKSLDKYNQWMKLRKDNFLVHWKYSSNMVISDFEKLLKEPRKFLEILILTGEYYDINVHNSGLIERYNTYNQVVDSLMVYLEFENKEYNEYPYDSSIGVRRYNSLDPGYNKRVVSAVHMLSHIADKISDEELFEILSPNSIINYNHNLRTDDLIEYKYLIGFLIATQYERILSHPNKDRTFEILNYFWQQEFISWALKYFISDLLIQIDTQKARQLFSTEFDIVPETGSFTRNAIIKTLVTYDFDANKEFIHDWYWKIQNKEFRTMPIEWHFILTILKDSTEETQELYNKIINDSRFTRKEFIDD